MMFWKSSEIEAMVRKAVMDAMADDKFDSIAGKEKKIQALEKQIVALEIEKAKKIEDFARRERETEHKVGLERKRQEFEIQQAKRETRVELREANLEADRIRFEDQMKFEREHLQKQVVGLEKMVGQLLERLPSAEIIANVGNGGGGRK